MRITPSAKENDQIRNERKSNKCLRLDPWLEEKKHVWMRTKKERQWGNGVQCFEIPLRDRMEPKALRNRATRCPRQGGIGRACEKSEADGSGGVEPPLRVLVRVCWRGSVTQTVLKGGSEEQGLSCRRIKKARQAGLARPPSLIGINL